MNNELTKDTKEELKLFLEAHDRVMVQIHTTAQVEVAGSRIIFYELNEHGEPFKGMNVFYFKLEET